MKKTLFLLTALLPISCVACFAGCVDKKGNDTSAPETKILLTEDDGGADNGNGGADNGGADNGGDCDKHGMPEFRFEHKNGRPVKGGKNHKKGRPHCPPDKPDKPGSDKPDTPGSDKPAPPPDEENPVDDEGEENL